MCRALAAFKRIHQCIYNKTAASWGMGGPPPFSPSLFSKKKPFVIWDIIMTTYVMMSCFDCYATIFQWIFFTRRHALICADRPTGLSRRLKTTTMQGCSYYARDALISTRNCCIIPDRQRCSHQHCLHPLALCGQPSTTTVTHINT